MFKRVITKEARVRQIIQGSRQADFDGSIQMALKALQAQIQQLYVVVNDVVNQVNTDYNADGTTDKVGRASPALVRMRNSSGMGLNQGSVVVRHFSETDEFSVTTTRGDFNVIGTVFLSKAEGTGGYDVVDGDECLVCVSGQSYVIVNADAGAISIGDSIVSHTTAGMGVKAESPEEAGVFATALEAKGSGVGKIRALIRSAALINGPAILDIQNFDHSLFQREGHYVPYYDDNGTETGFSGYLKAAGAWTDSGMSQLIGHWNFKYNMSGFLQSSIHSVYDMAGNGALTVKRALEYQQGRLARIISEI